jgi:hypothetical protein
VKEVCPLDPVVLQVAGRFLLPAMCCSPILP